jgi:hypothetical protein
MSEQTPVDASKTPTGLLIQCMEDFSNDEPKRVIVLYETESGWLRERSTGLLSWEKVGMLRMMESHLTHSANNQE